MLKPKIVFCQMLCYFGAPNTATALSYDLGPIESIFILEEQALSSHPYARSDLQFQGMSAASFMGRPKFCERLYTDFWIESAWYTEVATFAATKVLAT